MPIVRRSISELRATLQVDRAKVEATTEADIDRQIAEDTDTARALSEDDIAAGLSSGQVQVIRREPVNVRAIRKALGLSQEAFAARFGFPLASLRNWEQGRRRPEGAALTLLRVIAKEPEAVRRALSGT